MNDEVKKQLKIFSIASAILIIILLIAGIFTVRLIYLSEEKDDKISAKEGLELVMGIDRYQGYANNITEISSRGLSKNGKADNWFIHFMVEENGSTNFFNVNIAKNGTYYPFENQTGYIDDLYISDWEIDSTKIMETVEDLDKVKDFYREYRLLGVGLGHMRIEANSYYPSIGCVAIIEYHAGGGLLAYHEIWVYIDGTTGDFIDVEYFD